MTETERTEERGQKEEERIYSISPLCSLLIFICFLLSPFDELESVAIENTLFVPETIMCFNRVEKNLN